MKNEPEGEQGEAGYRQILDAAPDAMVTVGPDGAISFVNQQTEKLFGYARAELLGQRLDMLIPERFRSGHGAHLARYFAAPSPRPMGSGLELFGRRKDGTELQIEVSLSPVQTAGGPFVAAAIRDIGARKQIEALAKLNADRLASAVESIQDAFALFDDADRLVLCNSTYRSLVGQVLPGPLVGRTFEEILDGWRRDLAFSTEEEGAHFRAERIARRRDSNVVFDVRTRDGRSLRVMDRRTAEGGVVKTIWDLTDDVRLAEELRQSRQAAEAASAAKSEFLSSMSHELRTPLNAVLGFAQLLQRDKKEPLSPRHQERAQHIIKGGEHLLRLIDDILDLSRIEAGGVSISTEPVNVGEVVAEVVTTLESTAARVGVAIERAPLPPSIPMVAADRTRFAQILMNLGTNAIKYNRQGGHVSLAISLAPDDYVRVAVCDTGIGIPFDKQDKLFQPFQRAGQESGSIEGTGIGLVIIKRLAALMGGRLGFRSAPGTGSEFWVDMPTHAEGVLPAALRAQGGRDPSSLEGGARRRVLYVEDNPANVAFMRDLVSSLDSIDLVTAPTAEMGVELARDKRPDLVIMDINLPGMSGIDALQLLRRDPDTKDIPVIALTAAASDRDAQRGMQAGFYRYLTKPVKVDEMMAALESVLAAAPE